MSLKNLFSLIKDDEDSGTSLNLDVFSDVITTSEEFKEQLLDLKNDELDSLIKLFADSKRPDLLSKLINFLNEHQVEYNTSTVVASLFKLDAVDSDDFFIKNNHLLSSLSPKNALCLSPFMDSFPEKFQNIIEASLAKRKASVEAFKEHLQDQIEFLKSQQLTDKALEYEEKLKFHFSETTQDLKTYAKSAEKSKDQTYAHVIERNLSFESRSKERLGTTSKRVFESLKKDDETNLELAELWYTELKDKDIELLLTQLELMDFNNSSFYGRILRENKNLPVWTKIFLHIKSKNFLEGLEFLDVNEPLLLTDSAESIYNYYYTKGVMLLGAGMQKEAEDIFNIIKEQKGNYRDIQLLLQESK